MIGSVAQRGDPIESAAQPAAYPALRIPSFSSPRSKIPRTICF